MWHIRTVRNLLSREAEEQKEFSLGVTGVIREIARRSKVTSGARWIVRGLVQRANTRWMLNRVYNALPPKFYPQCYSSFAKLFAHDIGSAAEPGIWSIDFAGKSLRLPLTRERFWLDWDLALSIVGHDTEIVDVYTNMLQSATRPDLFIDVGANYGTHSLLFLVNGINTLTIEPNPACHTYFAEICALNGVSPWLESVALADRVGTTKLEFSERETWLGQISDVEELVTHDSPFPTGPLVSVTVPVRTLDSYFDVIREHQRVLIKIDAEHSEQLILAGAGRVLAKCRPIILFEAQPSNSERGALYDTIIAAGYRIARLPWVPEAVKHTLSRADFCPDAGLNFVAVPFT